MLSTKEKYINLRNKGFTLGKIIQTTKLPKTTIYYHIKNISLPPEITKRIKRASAKRINEFNIKYRKGKCIPGRIVLKPIGWTDKLIFLAAHFMFDGEINKAGCVYNNRSKNLISEVKDRMEEVFHLQPRDWVNKKTGVHRISYYYVELASYFRKKSQELKRYIKIASLSEKKIFLQAFYDDEGCVNIHKNNRRVRGYQHNLEMLSLIQRLLKDFDIKSRIEEKGQEIVINGKENLIKFRGKINFSKGIFINPDRKNSIWKRKLEEREILNIAIKSYQK